MLARVLGWVSTFVGEWFLAIRLAGAGYLCWLGVMLWRSRGRIAAGPAGRAKGGFFLQGLLVVLANPKVLLFFGAFLPQFIDPAGNYATQIALLGGTFLATALVLDSAYALMSSGFGAWLSRRRVMFIERISAGLLIGGGLWLALARR